MKKQRKEYKDRESSPLVNVPQTYGDYEKNRGKEEKPKSETKKKEKNEN